MGDVMKGLAKHIFWGLIAIVMACLAIIYFGNEEQMKTAVGVLAGLAGLIVFSIFAYGATFL